MKKIFEKIRQMSLPYQDKRGDTGHHAVTLAYAQKLAALEGGDESIVLPAIILHDLGWSQVKPERWQAMFTGKMPREQAFAVIQQHQNESVRLAAGILNELDYPPGKTHEILEIILQHDTRPGFISKNEGLVRDADKLWRYCRVGFDADTKRSGAAAVDECARLEREVENPRFIYSNAARLIARRELAQRIVELWSGKMKPIYKAVRELALPYQDKRDDVGHHLITLNYAWELLGREKGDEDVIIPAVILHDIGWSCVKPKDVAVIFDAKTTIAQELVVRYQHQNESVRLAASILDKLEYPHDKTAEILEIILQHDTRDGFISANDGLVRDADKLWRFSETGFGADVRRFKNTRADQSAKLEKELSAPRYMYSTSAMKMAREELNSRKKHQ